MRTARLPLLAVLTAALLGALLLGCGASNTGVPIPGFTSPSPATARGGSAALPSNAVGSSALASSALPADSMSGLSTPKAGSRCVRPNPALLAAISAHLQSGVTVRNAYVVQSDEGQKLYFLAGDMEGLPGMQGGNDIAIFASDTEDGSGTIYAVGAVANEDSDFADGGQNSPKLGITDDGARQARACALGS